MRPRLAALVLVLLTAAQGLSQVTDPGEDLLVLSSPHFDFYFPPSLGPEAQRLLDRAEGIREGIVLLLGSSALELGPGLAEARRLPVLLTASFPQTNGYYTSWPFRKIVLYASPPEVAGDLGSLDDPLVKAFTHELAHALSLPPRGILGQALSLLGEAPSPTNILAPASLVEGLAVVAESQGGGGRLQDLAFAASLDQDLREGRRRTFWEVAGGRDSWPGGSLWYEYGAAFSSWLLARKGLEALGAFWDDLARARGLVGAGPLFRAGPFQRAFGEDLRLAWEAFLDERTQGLATESYGPPRPSLGGERTSIPALCQGQEGRVYWVDAGAGAILANDGPGKKPRRLAQADSSVSRLALSADGAFLLVSSRRAAPGLLRGSREDVVREYDLRAGTWSSRTWTGLREASYLEDGSLVAIAPRGMETDLVLVDSKGPKLLLQGSEGLSFGSPLVLGSWLYCLANREGQRRILRLAPDSGPAGGPGTVEYLDLSGLAIDGTIPSLNWLGGGNQILSFALAWPGRAPRLAVLRPGEQSLLVQDRPPRGSLGLPSPGLGPGSGLAYRARFSDGDEVSVLDLDEENLQSRPLAWLPLEPPRPGPAGPAPAVTGPAPYGEARPAPALPRLGATSRLPSLDLDSSSAGIEVSGLDLTETLAWTASAAWAWEVGAANLGAGLDLYLGKLALSLEAWDSFQKGQAEWYRLTGLSLGIEARLPLEPLRRSLWAGLLAGLSRSEAVDPTSPYAWGGAGLEAGARLSLGYRDLKSGFRPPFPSQGLGLSLWSSLESASPGPVAGLGTSLDFHIPAIRLDGSLHIEAGLGEGLVFGPGGAWVRRNSSWTTSILGDPAPPFVEYANYGLADRLYARAELGSALLDLEIQAPVLGFFWARRLVLRAGARAAVLAPGLQAVLRPWDARLLSSLWARLDLEFAPLAGSLLAQDFRASLELSRALDEEYGTALSWTLRFAYKVEP